MADLGNKKVTMGKITSNVQKKFSRMQEKLLQKLGKTDETKDEQFDQCIYNFNIQFSDSNRLQKDLRNYLKSSKAMHEASKNLMECLHDLYESDWSERQETSKILDDSDMLWISYHQKLIDQALRTIDNYVNQFPNLKTRIAKRGRKLIDYDSARHNYEFLQIAKKRDEVKIAKAEEELMKSYKTFKDVHVDLKEELDFLWHNRAVFYGNTFQSIIILEENFHKDMSRLYQNLNDVLLVSLEKLPGNSSASPNLQRADSSTSYGTRKIKFRPKSEQPHLDTAESSFSKVTFQRQKDPNFSLLPTYVSSQDIKQEDIISFDSSFSPGDRRTTLSQTRDATDWDGVWKSETVERERASTSLLAGMVKTSPDTVNGSVEGLPSKTDQPPEFMFKIHWIQQDFTADNNEMQSKEELVIPSREITQEQIVQYANEYLVPSITVTRPSLSGDMADWEDGRKKGVTADDEASTSLLAFMAENRMLEGSTHSERSDLPPGFLFKVKAQHDYPATDSHELQLKAGDVVLVMETPEQQKEGWLLGVKESDWQQHDDLEKCRGVFPENLTERIQEH